jgi:K+-transporting ATPase ATPase C chain
MFKELRTALLALLVLTVLTGLIYPLLITGLAKVAFARQSGGSLIEQQGKIVGSSLIGQPFDAPKYFFSRPSATSPTPYNAASSSGSNLGPTNPALRDAVKARVAVLQALDPDNPALIPVDLVTASGSGLDPDISPAAAAYQAPRVARVRGVSLVRVNELIAAHTSGRALGVFGEPAVHVLELNLALDSLR